MTQDCLDPTLTYRPLCQAAFEEHASAWRPYLIARCGPEWAERLITEARVLQPEIVRAMPYIGGPANPLLRHLVGSTTSLALYEAASRHGWTSAQVGELLYRSVTERMRQLPPQQPPDAQNLERLRTEARHSQERRYPQDWVWDFVAGDGVTFDYGYDFFQCPTHALYCARSAGAFLPYYCYLDFVTYRVAGWSFQRTMTLGEGGPKCDFRFRRGGITPQGWPPPFQHP